MTTTDEVIDRSDRALQEPDATLLEAVAGGRIVEAAGHSTTAPIVAAPER